MICRSKNKPPIFSFYSLHIQNLITMPTSPQFKYISLTGMHCLTHFYFRNLTQLRAFITFVRPILEYASQIWNPFIHKSVDDLEHVQRYFTSRIPALKNLSYSDRLALLNVDSLEIRRLRSDLNLYHNIFNNLVCINSSVVTSQHSHLISNTRSSGARLVSFVGRTLTISNIFSRDKSIYGTLYHLISNKSPH